MRQLTSSELAHINDWLIDKYGYFCEFHPKYKIVWSDDQLEKRYGTFEDFTSGGLFIREYTGVREVPKYQYISERYVLERCFGVPEGNEELVTKTTYEPIWTFEGKNREFLLPITDALWWIIEGIHAAENKAAGVRYKDPREDINTQEEQAVARKRKIYEALYGDITPISDALDYGSAVSIGNTNMWDKQKEEVAK